MLNSDEFAGVQYEVRPDRTEESASFDIRIIKKTHGIGNEQVLHSEFFQSAEYRSIGNALSDVMSRPNSGL